MSESTSGSLAKRYIPIDIWHRQRCPNCNRTLSVGPIMLSSGSKFVCGRCKKAKTFDNVKCTKSLYNIVACGFTFPCLYTYIGCNTQLSIFEMANHEQLCKATQLKPSHVFCRFCKFEGLEIIEIIMHMRRCHMAEAIFEHARTLFSITADKKLTRILFLEDGIFLLHLEYDSCTTSLIISIDCLSVVRPRLFSIKIRHPEDPSEHVLLQTTNDVNLSLVALKTSYNQLNDKFGINTVLSYELIVENLDVSLEEQALLLRLIELRENEQSCETIVERYNLLTKTMNEKFDAEKQTIDAIMYIAPTVLKCTNCNILNPGKKHYTCSEGHIYCRTCVRPKCGACKEFREFYSADNLLKQEVICEWPECDVVTELHHYMSHKATCSHRTYFCPLKGCYQYFTSIPELAVHWHAATPGLVENNSHIVFGMDVQQEFFWVFNHDIYRVLVKISKQIQIIIDDFDVILNGSKIYCYGIKDNVSEEIPTSNICGCFQVLMSNLQADNPDQFIYDKVKIQIVSNVFC